MIAADVLRVWVNRALSIARDIAIGRNLKLFARVSVTISLPVVIINIGSLNTEVVVFHSN